MHKLKKIIVLSAAFSLSAGLCLGCAKVPKSQQVSGVNYAVSDGSSGTQGAVESLKNLEQYISKGANGYHCTCSLGEGDKTLNIDADIGNYDVESVCDVKAEPDPAALDKEQINKILFGNEMVESSEDAGSGDVKQSGESAATVGMPSTQHLNYTDKDHTKRFTSSTDSGFYYSDSVLISKYNLVDSNGGKTGSGDLSDQYTLKAACGQLTDTISDIAGMDIVITNSKNVSDGNGNGYYELTFSSAIKGIPLAINDRESNTDDTIDSIGIAVMGQEGIAKIEATNLVWKEDSEGQEQNCLKLGQALSVLETDIASGKIACNSKIIFPKCGLVYLAKTDDWKNAALTPVWRFFIPEEQLVESEMSAIAMDNNIPTDICINAVDGSIEQMQ